MARVSFVYMAEDGAYRSLSAACEAIARGGPYQACAVSPRKWSVRPDHGRVGSVWRVPARGPGWEVPDGV